MVFICRYEFHNLSHKVNSRIWQLLYISWPLTWQNFLFNFLICFLIRDRERWGERKGERGRETSICCSTYLCIHWLILLCAPTRNGTSNLLAYRTTLQPTEPHWLRLGRIVWICF